MKTNYILCTKCMYSNMLHSQLSSHQCAPKVCEDCYSFTEGTKKPNQPKKAS